MPYNSVVLVTLFRFGSPANQEESLMRKITMTLAVAVFVLGSMTLVNAQTQAPGASSIQVQAQQATPIMKTGCFRWGRCPPGRHWVCGRYHCGCAFC
jgi:protein-S-isoprenylcysteine O-methyltransferase Ste14